MPTPATPRHCLVTGANRGIGLEFVRQLLARGERVVATCRQPARAHELNQLAGEHPGRLHVLPLDVADPKAHAELAREWPLVVDDPAVDRIDLLVNNAGVLHSGERFGDVSAEQLDDSWRINARGPFLLTQALAPLLADASQPHAGGPARDAARVANLSSQLGSIAGLDGFHTPSYAISKAAQNMASALLADALAPRGIVVLALHPGWVKTRMGGDGAQLAPVDAVAGMLAVIDGASMADSGRFVDHAGKPLAW